MALKSGPVPFPLCLPNLSAPRLHPCIPTEVRFSRWNNANAEPFLRRQRLQKEIEDDIRRHRRFHSATKIADASDVGERTAASPPPEYKSPGTPSSPSSPSIPGKASKYSRPPENPGSSHPAFGRIARAPRRARVPPPEPNGETGISISENGIAYKIKDAPFEFQYSYTETPKVKPLALREPPFLPFGPVTMPRPWTGRAPLPPSKKKLPEFDSFRLPPAGKKGVKPVQAPGPFLAGSGPKHTAATREEILGEPLSKEEIKELVKGSLKGKRQLNMGRDGLTHNMLDNIHAHWKRRRVCRIKCKGVCTVDMDNVRQQLEEKTGGEVIYGRGGVIYLYRGRNYNYRTRPRFPLMLWKPITPVYPRLIQRVPEGLTLEEATEMRKKGRQLPPICKLGKNGLYSNLVKDVKEAFEACELVRINCKDMNKSDCRKIGAKLKDLVPCVLLSFEYENILMWRGKDWKSSLAPSEDGDLEAMGHTTDAASDSSDSLVKNDEIRRLHAFEEMNEEPLSERPGNNMNLVKGFTDEDAVDSERPGNNMNLVKGFTDEDAVDFIKMDKIEVNEVPPVALSFKATATTENLEFSTAINQELSASGSDGSSCGEVNTENTSQFQRVDPSENKGLLFPQSNANALSAYVDSAGIDSSGANTRVGIIESVRVPEMLQEETLPDNGMVDSNVPWLEGVMLLVNQAVECGSAVVLDDDSLNADIVLAKSIDLAKKTHRGPIFRHPSKKTASQKAKKEKIENSEEEDVETFVFSQRKGDVKSVPRARSRKNEETFLDVVPHGSLRVDELAKLLT